MTESEYPTIVLDDRYSDDCSGWDNYPFDREIRYMEEVNDYE
jgi:hypothetical protein